MNEEIPDTHFFVYKDKKYPIKISFFKHSSKYFSDNIHEIKRTQNIQLIDEETLDITNDIIESFIKFAHYQQIQLTNENVTELNFLSKRYEILPLIKYTNEYINKHHDELVLKILLIHQNNSNFETENYETILSQHLNDYIDDERLMKLKFPMIYRIITKYSENQTQNSSNSNSNFEKDKFIEFLFKCLDFYGKEASILFTKVDFSKEKTKYLNRLFKDYSEIFDFHCINSSFVKNLYEFENELISMINEEKKKNCEQEIKIKNLNETIQMMKSEINQIKSFQINQQNQQQQKEKEKNLLINKIEKENQEMKTELNQIKLSQIEQQNQQQQKIKEKDLLIKKIEKENQEMKLEINQIKSFLIQKQKKEENSIEINNSKKLNDDDVINKKIKNDIQNRIKETSNNSLIEVDSFNQLNGNKQIDIIKELQKTKNDENTNNLFNLLTYINKNSSKGNKNNYIFLFDENNKNGKIDSIVGASCYVVDELCEKGEINSTEFSDHIEKFSKFYIELKYPSPNFDKNYKLALNLKKSHMFKLKISIFISGIKETDQKFFHDTNINFVKLDKTVTKIVSKLGSGTFEGCKALTGVIIPYSVTSIESSSFYRCSSLKQIKIPFSVVEIGRYTFDGCSSLERITIPSSIKRIEKQLFNKCESLIEINIPSSVISIDEDAFRDCSSLSQISIPSSVTSIKHGAFIGCSSLTQITIPSCINLSNLGINSNVKVIRTSSQ